LGGPRENYCEKIMSVPIGWRAEKRESPVASPMVQWFGQLRSLNTCVCVVGR
jgi:hypothetical protein